ncbi:hypothetical protein OG243_22190 [Streptomyces sp. NBC_01318]|uniref:FG-GAP repeat protein n=1 Tax=unclassified Streptomyces TaxID=2593676 RepID=UPI002E0E8D2B|nr:MULTISPECIES: FG-GAP repeat protein [unclassified Streptomyces]WSJ52034.1 hypothetical protein OG243_22190 [Streptomyces sp. NBC_01318]
MNGLQVRQSLDPHHVLESALLIYRPRQDGKAELFVGAADENNSTGAVWVLPGGTSGPTAAGSRMFTASSVGLTQQYGTLLGGNGLLWVM